MSVGMPKLLLTVLANCPQATALEIWNYLDGNPEAVSEMIRVVVDCHPKLQEQTCLANTMMKRTKSLTR